MVLSGGAAGGGKPFTGCCWIVKNCIEFPGIKMVIARKTFKMLKKTTWGTLNSVLALWGFKENIHFHMDFNVGKQLQTPASNRLIIS
jgi:hypothetical protein